MYQFLPKLLKNGAAAGDWVSPPRGHIAFITGFALLWGEESQGFVLGPNMKGTVSSSEKLPPAPERAGTCCCLFRETPCCVQSSSRHQRSVAQEQSGTSVLRRRICYSDLVLETSLSCLSQ